MGLREDFLNLLLGDLVLLPVDENSVSCIDARDQVHVDRHFQVPAHVDEVNLGLLSSFEDLFLQLGALLPVVILVGCARVAVHLKVYELTLVLLVNQLFVQVVDGLAKLLNLERVLGLVALLLALNKKCYFLGVLVEFLFDFVLLLFKGVEVLLVEVLLLIVRQLVHFFFREHFYALKHRLLLFLGHLPQTEP